MRRLLVRLRDERSGLALIEFALVVPVLLVLYLAGYQVSDVISCNRKVTIATRAVADLVSQYAIMSPSQLDQILAATTQVMSPYPTNSALIRVSQVTPDPVGQGATVKWSRAINGAKRVKGSSYTMPANMPTSGLTYILAEVNYAYVPAVNFGFMSSKGLSETIFMVPRVSSTIDCDDCT